jgi:hypothetical protein
MVNVNLRSKITETVPSVSEVTRVSYYLQFKQTKPSTMLSLVAAKITLSPQLRLFSACVFYGMADEASQSDTKDHSCHLGFRTQ